MALFEPNRSRDDHEVVEIGGSDAATRALSVTVVENDFVANVYEKLASVYDIMFGPVLHPGRVDAIRRMGIRSDDRVLEVGVGTGINAALYPRDCAVTGIDLSSSMLEKAHDRIARKGVRNVRLMQMDAANLKFADDTFDIVYAPYVISVVPDPIAVTREMRRVCRPGGRIVILNHFLSSNRLIARVERVISPATVHIGFKSDLDLPAFLAQSDLKPISIEKVNVPRIWSLVTCVKS
jgi:phosphatidylethanolamine/phosphatidyl-N-methylethanolamine N-methyltransferase